MKKRIFNIIILVVLVALAFFIDKTLALWVNFYLGTPTLFTSILKILSSYFVLIPILILSIFFVLRKNENWKNYLLAILYPYILGLLIKLVYHRPRPYEALNYIPVVKDFWWSFPSLHTILAFAIAFCLGYMYRRKFSLFIILASLVALSRILLGVHYLSDILAGILISYIFYWIFFKEIDEEEDESVDKVKDVGESSDKLVKKEIGAVGKKESLNKKVDHKVTTKSKKASQKKKSKTVANRLRKKR